MINKLKTWWQRQMKGPDKVDTKTIVIALLFLLFALIFSWIEITSNMGDVRFNNEEAHVLEGQWKVSYNGKTTTTTLPSKVEASSGDKIEMTRVLDEESINGNSLIFYSRQTWVEVYIDDELLVEFVENEDVSVKMTPGSYWHFFRLPENYDGKTLKIVFTPVINRYAGELPIIYAGTKTAIVYMVFSQGNVSILLVLPVLFWGIGLCCIGIFSNQRVIRQKLCRLGLFAIATGIWSLLESRVIQMFFGNVAVLSYLLFSCYYLIPVLTASFLLTFVTLGKRRYIRGLFWIAAAFFVVVQLLQITNTAYYIQMVPVAHVLFVFIILSVIVSYIDLQRKKENIPDKSIYRAAILLGIFCVIDMITYYVYPVMIVGSFSKVGFLLFFAYLGHSALRQIGKMEIQDAENRVYQQLAYVDMMTGLSK